MSTSLSVAEVLAKLQARIAFHQEQAAFHAQQEVHHRERFTARGRPPFQVGASAPNP